MTPSARNRPVPRLSESEWAVMKPFWEQGPMAARDLYAALAEGHGWAYKTVKTMLARLVKKGALTYTQVGNSYLYEAAYSREAITAAAAGSFVERVFDGALTPFMAYFAEKASPEELKQMRTELEALERAKQKEGAEGR